MISMIYWRHWTFVSTISILPIPNFFFLLDSTMFISVMYQLQLHVTFFLQWFPDYIITSGRGEQSNRLQIVGLIDWRWWGGGWGVIAFTVTVHTNRVVCCTLHGNWFVQVLVPYIATYQTIINKTYKVCTTLLCTYDLHCSLLLLLHLSWTIFYSMCTLWICHIIYSLFYAFRN